MIAGAWGRTLAVDRIFLAYLAAIGLLGIIWGGPLGWAVAAAHAVVGWGVLWLARRKVPERGAGRFFRLAYPVAVTPLFYRELAIVNRFLTERYFDGAVQGWEAALFGGQPSMDMSSWLPSFTLSEFLHFGYGSYYLIVPIALVGAYMTSGGAALHRTAFAVAVAFYLSYLIFTLYPVAGPRYLFPAIDGPIADGSFHAVVHVILEGGSSRGSAFPSSHIAASLAAVLGAAREDRRWLWLLIVPEVALAIGTVYGRFHYGIDAVLGIALGVLIWLAAPSLMRAVGGRQPGRAPVYQSV